MEINLLLPNLDENLNEKLSISLWSALCFTLNIAPKDAIKVYSAVRKEAVCPKNIVPANQLYKLIRANSKNVKQFNELHTSLSKITKTIYFDKRGSISFKATPSRKRDKQGRYIPDPEYDYQKITISWERKISDKVNKIIIKRVNEKKIERLSFIKCMPRQLVMCQIGEKEMGTLVEFCKIRSKLDNKKIINWLINIANLSANEVSALIGRYEAKKSRSPLYDFLNKGKTSSMYFKFKHKISNGLILGDDFNLYWFTCHSSVLNEVYKRANTRKSMKLIQKSDNEYKMDDYVFRLVSSTTNIPINELKISSRIAGNYVRKEIL